MLVARRLRVYSGRARAPPPGLPRDQRVAPAAVSIATMPP